jgi:hypothetical protein
LTLTSPPKRNENKYLYYRSVHSDPPALSTKMALFGRQCSWRQNRHLRRRIPRRPAKRPWRQRQLHWRWCRCGPRRLPVDVLGRGGWHLERPCHVGISRRGYGGHQRRGGRAIRRSFTRQLW